MQFRRFKCYECGYEADFDFPSCEAIPKTQRCSCGKQMKRMLCSNFYVDHWTPTTNNGTLDYEHFQKKAVKNGKYVSKQCAYVEDKIKKDIPVNLREV